MSKNTNLSFLTDYITADITNGRIGINNASPTVAFDVSGATKISGTLTLTSTISNGTYSYTLPSATGTLALTSSLSSYLPLSGGTLTGALSGTSATFTSSVTTGGNLTIGNTSSVGYIYGPSSQIFGAVGGSGTYLFTGTNGLYFNNAADTVNLGRLTNGGLLGIGNTDPKTLLHITNTSSNSITDTLMLQNGGNTSNTTTGVRLIFKLGAFGSTQINTYATIDAVINGESSIDLLFKTPNYGILFPPNERMRITGGGDVLVGTTISGVLASGNGITLNAGGMLYVNSDNTSIFNRSTNSSGTIIQFRYNEATVVGTISITSSTTAYNTNSDYRLKEDLKPFNGLEKVLGIKVYDFKWKSSNDRMDGVLAHELQEVLPYAVTGIKDGEETQAVDYSKIVPVLVKAIQELKVEIETLKQK